MTMIEWYFNLHQHISPWGDLAALCAVLVLLAWHRTLVAFVVFIEFALVYVGQDWLRETELWGGLALDYHYGLGIKDALMCLILIRIRANPLITVSYVSASLLCWAVWASHSLLEYEKFITVYHAWSPLYFLAMVIQVTGLYNGGRDAGILARVWRVSTHRDWIFRAFNSAPGSHTAATSGKTDGEKA